MCEEQLLRDLDSCLKLLEGVGESHWSQSIRKAVGQFAESGQSVQLARTVQGWFGGMGSFNDLILSGLNGHNVAPGSETIVNSSLTCLRRSIYGAIGDF
jgi:hypothetical protein